MQVGALIAVGKGNMEEARIVDLLALGSKEFPGDKVQKVPSVENSCHFLWFLGVQQSFVGCWVIMLDS